jgi:pimeloyl-ACP methyl ester carboxylesterase
MRVRFVDVDGIQTRCLMGGNEGAYPLLLLHGYGGTADVWIRNIDELSRDFFVVAPDMLNSGLTDFVDTGGRPPQGQTLAHMRRLADILGFKSFCPCGTSYGGLIAALLYFDMPERVNKLILNGSGTCFNEDADLVATLKRVLVTFGPVMENASIEGCRTSMSAQALDPKSVPEEILPVMASSYARRDMLRHWKTGIEGLLDIEACKPYNVRDRLEQIAAETLVVWGREDRGAIYASGVAGAKRMPRAELVTFEKCGHKPMFEYPELYNDIVRAFLLRA